MEGIDKEYGGYRVGKERRKGVERNGNGMMKMKMKKKWRTERWKWK